MIKKSFIFLPKIGQRREFMLWKMGISCWDDFVNAGNVIGISKTKKRYYDSEIKKASDSIKCGSSNYFTDKLKATETWRLYDVFSEDAVFLDIETTGVTKNDKIIVFGLFDGYKEKIMIKNYNLVLSYLQKELLRYKLIITYNGGSFDIPFINKRYPKLLPDIPHIDLRPLCTRLGLINGLKDIEIKFGIKRSPIVKKMKSGDAYRLYRMYLATGDMHYLNLLIEYNTEDVINLKRIADYVICQNEKLLVNPGFLVSF